jgi:hypothetical protein
MPVRNVPSGVLPEALEGESESRALRSVAEVVKSPLPTACCSWFRRLLKTVCCDAVAPELPKSMLDTGRIAEVLIT